MKKNLLVFLILISGILTSGAIIGPANAQTEPLLQPQEQKMPGDIQYPIPELDNCKSKSSCKVFCDDVKNSDACLTFAEQRNLMSPKELANAKKFKDSGMVGPGGCKGQVACEQYCSDSTKLEECTTFAKKNGMMSDKQLQDSEKVLAAIKNGLKPPACGGPKQCNTYCSNPLHMEECIAFSLAAGLVPDKQKIQMQKTLEVIKQGIKPPACRPNPPSESEQTQLGQTSQPSQSEQDLPSCDQYCGTHTEECMSFSLATGMVPDDQKEQMQKTLNVLKSGIKPPACQPNQSDQPNQSEQSNRPSQQNKTSQSGQGLQACDQYCADSSHIEECVKFSVAMGNMTEQQAQNSIKNGGKGPGGCVGKEACNAFCDNSDNQETCFEFGKENGMIPAEDLQKMQEGQQKMKDAFSQIPQEVLDCITTSSGADVVEKMKTGSMTPRKAGDSINQCFQKFSMTERPPGQDLPGGDQQMNQNQSDQTNQKNQPGDKFQPRPGTKNGGGQQMPQQAGPGGCKGPEECQKYCDSNPEICKNFQPQQDQLRQPGEQQPEQPNQPGPRLPQQQPGQPNQGVTNVGPCGTGPGTCSGIGPDDKNSNKNNGGIRYEGQLNQPGQFNQPNQPRQFIQGEPNQPNQINQPGQQPGQFIQVQPGQPNQPGQIEPQQQPQVQLQPSIQQQNPPPSSPSSFLQGVRGFLANVLDAFR